MTRTAVIRAAACARWTGQEELTAILYRSGGTAVDPRQDPRWPRFLVDRAERPHPELAVYAHTRTEHWNAWTVPGVDASTLVHKVYASPAVPCLPDALAVVFAVASELDVPSWKVGADAAGLHRADKIVLYLPSARRADDVASCLASALDGLTAQGVLFTGQVGSTGIVSRGRDQGRQSWRAVLCQTVAVALHEQRAALGADAAPVDVADAALDRLAATYDVRGWHPETRVPA